jgi:hypothetical protein
MSEESRIKVDFGANYVELTTPEGRRYSVTFEGERLRIATPDGRALAIVPDVTNAIRVRALDRSEEKAIR